MKKEKKLTEKQLLKKAKKLDDSILARLKAEEIIKNLKK